MYKIEHTSRGLLHCIAECRECAWREEYYLKAARAASRHVRETGHTVSVRVKGVSHGQA